MAAGLGPGLLALALALWPAGGLSRVRTEASGPAVGKISESVSLTCHISGVAITDSSYAWDWIRQTPGKELQHLVMQYPFTQLQHIAAPFQTRVNSSADPSRNQLWLQLLSPAAADTATYFCSMRELEKGRGRTAALVFGNGTQLTVEPNIPKTSIPQVIVMKSKKLEEEEGGSPGKAACLARNIQTKSISLEMPSKEVVYEQSTSILTSEGLYNAIKVVSVTNDTEVTCTAKLDNSTMTAQPEEEAEEPVAGPSERVCNSTEPSAQDAEGQRVNMLSMAVLGLRVLLAKSIAINTLMSIKLFLL